MNSDVAQRKAIVRREMRARLETLTPAARALASFQLCEAIRSSSLWQQAKAVLLFAPLPNEPDIWPLVEASVAEGKITSLPRFVVESSRYLACRITHSVEDVQTGKFAIREPKESCTPLVLATIDLILVPGVAFDREGRRLGRGRGFYDRMLEETHRGTRCGVSFAEQLHERLPAEPHDIVMHYVATPEGLLKVGS